MVQVPKVGGDASHEPHSAVAPMILAGRGGDVIIHLIRRCELIPLDVPSLVRRPISYSFMRRSGKVCSIHRTLWRQRLGPLIAAQDNYRSSPICSCQLRTLQAQMYRPYRPGDYITATHTDASRMLSTKELSVCV